MQLTERFRRAIIVPTDDASLQSLVDEDDGVATAAVRELPIPTDDLFHAVWDTGLLDTINGLTGSLIDDYEDALVPPGHIASVRRAISMCRPAATSSREVTTFFENLEDLCSVASWLQKPMIFVL